MDEPCILLVEDSPAHATVAKYALAPAASRWSSAPRSRQRWRASRTTARPRRSAVVLDLTLPDSSGAETFDRVAGGRARRRSWC